MSSLGGPVAALCSLPAVAVLWYAVFRGPAAGFWRRMPLATAGLGLFALVLRRGPAMLGPLRAGDVWAGMASALVLWGVFWAGGRMLARIVPPSAGMAASVYGLTAGASPTGVTALLLLVIGPAEELYWRGLVQHGLQALFPWWAAVALGAAAYTAVHVAAKNPVLLLAALVGGLYWGALYALTGSLLLPVVSHALWDAMVLVWWPVSPGVRPAAAGGAGGRALGG